MLTQVLETISLCAVARAAQVPSVVAFLEQY
jgi:hypothetical protein